MNKNEDLFPFIFFLLVSPPCLCLSPLPIFPVRDSFFPMNELISYNKTFFFHFFYSSNPSYTLFSNLLSFNPSIRYKQTHLKNMSHWIRGQKQLHFVFCESILNIPHLSIGFLLYSFTKIFLQLAFDSMASKWTEKTGVFPSFFFPSFLFFQFQFFFQSG